MPTLRKPRALRPGAKVAIAAPAGPVDPSVVDAGCELVRRLGFEPVRRDDLSSRSGFLAGDDSRRAEELMQWVDDSSVHAILCARGGYGCHRIVQRLDPARFRKAAKPLVGYSDATTLLLWQRRCAGLVGFHGPMLERGADMPDDTRESLVRSLTGSGSAPPLEGRSLVGGWSEGRLVGGSLSLVVASLGTPWEVDARGAILMLEEVGEKPYRIDRMLQQLRAAGVLDAAVGIGVGTLCECVDERYPEPSALEVVSECLGGLEIPVVMDLPFGHAERNRTWPVGVRAAIDGDRAEIELLESGVVAR